MRLGERIDRGRKGLWRWTPTISVGAGAAAGEEGQKEGRVDVNVQGSEGGLLASFGLINE